MRIAYSPVVFRFIGYRYAFYARCRPTGKIISSKIERGAGCKWNVFSWRELT